jgi:hypothetical protein
MIMPRIAQEKSGTGIYHVMLRGIDKRPFSERFRLSKVY